MTVNRWWKHPKTMPVGKIVEVITDMRATPRKAYTVNVSVGPMNLSSAKLVDENGNDIIGKVLAWRLLNE